MKPESCIFVKFAKSFSQIVKFCKYRETIFKIYRFSLEKPDLLPEIVNISQFNGLVELNLNIWNLTLVKFLELFKK